MVCHSHIILQTKLTILRVTKTTFVEILQFSVELCNDLTSFSIQKNNDLIIFPQFIKH